MAQLKPGAPENFWPEAQNSRKKHSQEMRILETTQQFLLFGDSILVCAGPTVFFRKVFVVLIWYLKL